MTFLEAMVAASETPVDVGPVTLARPNGPWLRFDQLGKVTALDMSAAYIGDFLDLDDWQVSIGKVA